MKIIVEVTQKEIESGLLSKSGSRILACADLRFFIKNNKISYTEKCVSTYDHEEWITAADDQFTLRIIPEGQGL